MGANVVNDYLSQTVSLEVNEEFISSMQLFN